ncbi:MAG: sterol desaturase family protein [Myxococcota bacterium]
MEANWTPVAIAIPIFFLLVGVELLAARLMRRSVYRTGDALSDLGCGVLQQLVGVFARTILFAGYLAVYGQFRLAEWSTNSVWTWVVALLGVDLAYYWFHRTSHGVAVMWAAHVVHHQSEDYNLAVALRQGAVQPFFSAWFYLPLALMGIPPLAFAISSSINTLYQFWIHTRLVGRLGPLEWVLNTPSHHRVHHGRDPKYIDRNHAGALIVWDRFFGSFQPEEEEPTYGITHALDSYDPIRAHFRPYQELWTRARQAPGWDKLKLWFMPPGWTPEGIEWAPAKPLDAPPFDFPVGPSRAAYVVAQFAPLVPLTMMLKVFRAGPLDFKLVLAGLMIATLASVAALVEGRTWALRFEQLRLLALPAVSAFLGSFLGSTVAGLAVGGVFGLLSLLWLSATGRGPAPVLRPAS